MNWLTSLRANEPLRVTLYPLLVILGGVLAATGKVDADWVNLIIGLVASVLGVEVARAQVSPANPRA